MSHTPRTLVSKREDAKDDCPTAGTFDGEKAAREYAREFAAEQASVGGVQIDVRTRGGKLVARYLTRDGAVVDACAVR